jgi:hypothetical protein
MGLFPSSVNFFFYDTIMSSWILLFGILKRPYGQKEKEYLTRKVFRLSEERWVFFIVVIELIEFY